jgi:hypothetical protein
MAFPFLYSELAVGSSAFAGTEPSQRVSSGASASFVPLPTSAID